MAENPFVRMYRDLVRRINALPQVRLSRVDSEAPAEPAEGWALSVGRQRVALGATPTPSVDTDWTPLTLDAGFSGDVWWCVRGGVVYLHGRVTRDAGNWPATSQQFATLPTAALPSLPTGSPYSVYCASISPDGGPFAVAVSGSSGALSARAGAGVSTVSLEMSPLSWPVIGGS